MLDLCPGMIVVTNVIGIVFVISNQPGKYEDTFTNGIADMNSNNTRYLCVMNIDTGEIHGVNFYNIVRMPVVLDT